MTSAVNLLIYVTISFDFLFFFPLSFVFDVFSFALLKDSASESSAFDGRTEDFI